jgi:serine protease Do
MTYLLHSAIRANLTALILLSVAITSFGQTVPAVFDKKVPETLQDLQAIETHVKKLVEKLTPATVCVRIGSGQGSGVIIDREGHVLTAGHVSGKADQDVVIILHDGSRLKGKTLGANNSIDSGMVLITEKVDFPFVEMAKSSELKKGQWCLSLGHPGGYKHGRPPVARLGRIQDHNEKTIVSDCALVGGDSGGPLFDMKGRVIGIHSRLGGKVSSNVHVPVDTYRETWDRLVLGEVWGGGFSIFDFAKPAEAYLGVRTTADKNKLRIEAVTAGSPAEKAGLKMNDVILKIDQLTPATVEDLTTLLKSKRPGNQINVHIQRGAERIMIAVVLGKRT